VILKKSSLKGHEGNWTWSQSCDALTELFWGSGFPNDNFGNSDDRGVMVVEHTEFWWQDSSCLATTVDQKKVAPICQYEGDCPGGWQMFDGHCYQVSLNRTSWENAEADCYYKGGHLASIHSLAEHNLISKLVDPGTVLWFGASDAALEVVTITIT
jgi:hypothetical protein